MSPLAIEGDLVSSEQLAKENGYLCAAREEFDGLCHRRISWVKPSREKRADRKISFGRITLPHQLMRLVLTEQIYRAFRINAGHAYHK